MALVFDTETSGLPSKDVYNRYYPYHDTNKYDTSRIVSIAFSTDKEEKYFVVKPEGFQITNAHIHGITQDMAVQEGVSFNKVVEYLASIIDSVDTIVGHNIEFDFNVLLAELHRACPHNGSLPQDIIFKLKQKKQFCTMKNSVDMCKIKGSNGRFKYPKLTELYNHLFKEIFPAHHALYDARATNRCYLELMRLLSKGV